jgi:hypothetical protein
MGLLRPSLCGKSPRFAYTDLRTGRTIYEDAKGVPTRDYEVRRAVAAAQGIEVIEV